MSTPTIDVLGIGNLLLGDDGLGPLVVQRLADGPPRPGVRFLDLGTPGLDLANWLMDASPTPPRSTRWWPWLAPGCGWPPTAT